MFSCFKGQKDDAGSKTKSTGGGGGSSSGGGGGFSSGSGPSSSTSTPSSMSTNSKGYPIIVDEFADDPIDIEIPKWTRPPPSTNDEIEEYKEFMRNKFEAEARYNAEVLRRRKAKQEAMNGGGGY